jgi:hypothetical protein
VRIARGFFVDYGYDIQSAKQLGVPLALLRSNPTVINGSQILLIPLHKQSLGLDLSTRGGFEARVDAEHLDDYTGSTVRATSTPTGSSNRRSTAARP